ncbi:MAG: DUF2378 family protein [Deltaproteobacteria bacterium]|nr:DUF2378 family protein [Deltaproteobacteria bacterium]
MAGGHDERVVFGASVEALLRAFGPPWKPGAREALVKLGIEPEQPPRAAYPLELYMQLLKSLGEIHFPAAAEDERYFQMGQAFIRGFERTLIGRAQLSLLKLIGPRRTLDRLTRSFRNANNYTTANLRELASSHFEIDFGFVQFPGFYRGVLDGGLRAVGAANLSVELARREQMAATFSVRWTA